MLIETVGRSKRAVTTFAIVGHCIMRLGSVVGLQASGSWGGTKVAFIRPQLAFYICYLQVPGRFLYSR